IGVILEVQHKPDEAKARYRQALTIDPDATVAANNLAWLYMDREDDLDQALTLAKRVQQRLKDDPKVNDTLGWVYYKKHMVYQAIPYLQQGVAGDQNNAAHHFHLGMAHLAGGDRASARQSLERALKLDPAFPGADQALSALAAMQH